MTDNDDSRLEIIEEKLDLAERDRAEFKAWMALTVHNLQATMELMRQQGELMRQQHQEQIELLKKTAKTTTGRLQSGSPNWRVLLPPSWQK